jgi:hypothetical protein
MDVFSYFLFIYIVLPFCMRPGAQHRDSSPFPVSRWTVPASRRAFEQSKHKGNWTIFELSKDKGSWTVFEQSKDKGSWTVFELWKGDFGTVLAGRTHLNNLNTKGTEQFLNYVKESWTALEKKESKAKREFEQLRQVRQHLNNLKTKIAEQFLNILRWAERHLKKKTI